MSVSVRQATIQDIEQLVPLFDGYREFYGKPSDPGLARAFLLERFRHHESVVFLATDPEGAGVGFTQLYPSFSSVRMARTYILNDLFVVPSVRRKGVAAQLLKQAAEYGRAAGAVRLSLSTAHANKAARQLYEVLGWKRDEAFCEYGLVL